MFKKYLFLFITLCLNTNLKCIVILVHGTFALNENWYKPGGKFYNELEKQAKQLNQKLIPFTWSGELNYKARLKSAESLAKVILSYPENEPIILIGHSHGGNVINLASQLLYDPMIELISNYSEEKLLCEISTLIENNYEKICQNKGFKKSTINVIQTKQKIKEYMLLTIDSIKEISKLKNKLKSKTKTFNKKYLIDHVFLLGTPINTSWHKPHMSTVNHVYNLYSKKDSVQKIFGYYKKTLPTHERINNLKVAFRKFNGKLHHPTHGELHNQLIAKWILSIPEKLNLTN